MALFGRNKRPERRGTPFNALIVGVGNPGREYAGTRHNVGFDVVDELAKKYSVALKSSRDRALVAEVHSGDTHLLLATPTTFMNDSGNAVGPLALRYGISDPSQIIIVHDELDLEPGVVVGWLVTTAFVLSRHISRLKSLCACASALANQVQKKKVPIMFCLECHKMSDKYSTLQS